MYTVTFWAKTEPGSKRPIGVKYEQLDTWVGPATTLNLDDQKLRVKNLRHPGVK